MAADIDPSVHRGWLSYGVAALLVSGLGLAVAGSVALTTNAQTSTSDAALEQTVSPNPADYSPGSATVGTAIVKERAARRVEDLSKTAEEVTRTAIGASADARVEHLAKANRATRKEAVALAQEQQRAERRRAAAERDASETTATPTPATSIEADDGTVSSTAESATPSAASASKAAVSPYWTANWDQGPCTDASCHREWSFVQAEDPAQAYPELNKVSLASSLGITEHSGCCAAKFEVTRAALSANRMHSKVFKEFQIRDASIKRDQFGRNLQPLPSSGVDGTYRAWYYVPQDYTIVTSYWANIFQFKLSEENPRTQNPQWWVNLIGGPNGQPYLHVENWGNGRYTDPNGTMPVPKGRWFEIRADLYEGNKIDWYLDGQYWQTVRDASGSIGRGAATGTPQTWIFGVGHYGGVGRLYIDDVSFTP